ncbi:MAG: hypothetical protein JNM40_02185 [Myxococcales bacterium]|nr:hypothetical protein [Myxococcales bacterium]
MSPISWPSADWTKEDWKKFMQDNPDPKEYIDRLMRDEYGDKYDITMAIGRYVIEKEEKQTRKIHRHLTEMVNSGDNIAKHYQSQVGIHLGEVDKQEHTLKLYRRFERQIKDSKRAIASMRQESFAKLLCLDMLAKISEPDNIKDKPVAVRLFGLIANLRNIASYFLTENTVQDKPTRGHPFGVPEWNLLRLVEDGKVQNVRSLAKRLFLAAERQEIPGWLVSSDVARETQRLAKALQRKRKYLQRQNAPPLFVSGKKIPPPICVPPK